MGAYFSTKSGTMYTMLDTDQPNISVLSSSKNGQVQFENLEIHTPQYLGEDRPLIMEFTDNPCNGKYANQRMRTSPITSLHALSHTKVPRPQMQQSQNDIQNARQFLVTDTYGRDIGQYLQKRREDIEISVGDTVGLQEYDDQKVFIGSTIKNPNAAGTQCIVAFAGFDNQDVVGKALQREVYMQLQGACSVGNITPMSDKQMDMHKQQFSDASVGMNPIANIQQYQSKSQTLNYVAEAQQNTYGYSY